jgi:hypothetical protein
MADSDSTVAWHRIQLKKLREDLRNIEIRRFRVGEATDARARSETQRVIADLRRKISASEHIVGAYDRRTRRPLATDGQSLVAVRWSNWNSAPCNR